MSTTTTHTDLKCLRTETQRYRVNIYINWNSVREKPHVMNTRDMTIVYSTDVRTREESIILINTYVQCICTDASLIFVPYPGV